MRLLPVVALTFWLAGVSARVGEDSYPRFKKDYGKGLPLELAEDDDDDGADLEEDDEQEDADDEKDEGQEDDDTEDDEQMAPDDDTENSGKTKETSVHRKHFMDQYFLHSGPVEYEFGHVCEDPDDWQLRYEKRDFDKQRHQGQVKWGDAKGGYGEQLWDFNHDGNIEDELDSDPWIEGRMSKGFSGGSPQETRNGNKARGVIKEKVTITKKKNGRTVDQTKINMEKLADLDELTKKYEPKPFAGDLALIEEFNRKTQGVKKKVNPFKDDEDKESEEDSKGFFTFSEEIRRMGKPAVTAGDDKKSGDKNTKRVSIQERKDIRRYDLKPIASTKVVIVDEKSKKSPPIEDLVSKATINIDTKGKMHFDPVSGSLTDGKTGKKFKIFGILVDS